MTIADPVLVEQNLPAVDAEVEVKSTRRRNDRNKPRRKQKENTTGETENVTGQEAVRETPKARKPKQRAPRVSTEGETNVVREKADYTDGILRLKISNARARTVYTRLVRLMLAGYDGAGNSLETSMPIDTIEVSALGNAIGSAIFVADNLLKGNVVEQVSVTTDFVTLEGDEEVEGRIRGSPRLRMTLKRLPSWEAKEDEVLQKTRVYRSKVLGLPEDATA
jgi:hypothetical protein